MFLDLDCPFVVMVWTDTLLSLVKKTASPTQRQVGIAAFGRGSG